MAAITGSLAATGQSASFTPLPNTRVFARGSCDFNYSIWGTFVGTVVLERSFDAGTTWLPRSQSLAGTAVSNTTPVSMVVDEPEDNVLYRVNVTAYTSGTINYRLSR